MIFRRWKEINISNKLTVFRIALVPLIAFLLTLESFNFKYLIAGILFLIASYTDYLDGKLARKNNLVTPFGQIMDPLADKILICSVMVCFVSDGLISALAAILIIFREFLVTSIRFLIFKSSGAVIPANILGKLKTISQMTSITVIFAVKALSEISSCFCDFASNNFAYIYILENILIWISVAFSCVSGIAYIYLNRKSICADL